MTYFIENWVQILQLLKIHTELSFFAIAIAIIVGVPLGILVNYYKAFRIPILGSTNLIQAIPSMALLGFMIPLFGIGETSAIIVVVLYSLLPIVKNTYIGMSNIDTNIIETATGIGLKKYQILFKIQLPLALPYIMAGIRISAVTAVGIMTIAAFIGASGLGFLVFSGIRRLNTDQILAGAIPAVILALSVDYILGLFEFAVTPIGLKISETTNKAALKRKLRFSKLFLAVTILASGVGYSYQFIMAQSEKDQSMITIGSKDFTEQHVIAYMVAEYIEYKTKLKVKRQVNLGGTQIVFDALKRKDIDVYIEYTGTIYNDILKTPIQTEENAQKLLFDMYGIRSLKQMNFNNTYTLAMTKKQAAQYNISKISDLSRADHELKTGTSFEFLNRKDGLVGIKEQYSLDFKDSLALDSSSRYLALDNNEVQIIDAFSTDGLLKKFDLVTLIDDKGVFPAYYATPLVQHEILEKHPEIEALIETLASVLSNDVMIDLNYKVDVEQQDARVVAHQFLQAKKLVN